jgi:predicted transcriptional regulator of viral defense system
MPLQRIMHYVGPHGIVRPRDIEAIGLPREYLLRLHRQGKIIRSRRGLYSLPDAAITQRHSCWEACQGGAFCLLSSLGFHEITAQSPASVWIALPQGARRRAISSPSLRVVRLSGASQTEGIENHKVKGIPIRVYSAAKTVADRFQVS